MPTWHSTRTLTKIKVTLRINSLGCSQHNCTGAVMALACQSFCFPRLGRPLRLALGRAGTVVAILALLLQIFAPTAAQAQDGMIAVICGQDGPVQVRLNAAGDVEEAPCPECGDCAFCLLVSSPVAVPTDSLPSGLQLAVSDSLSSLSSVFSVNPAQFWPENRGPPLQTQNNSGLACRSTHRALLSGDRPWV